MLYKFRNRLAWRAIRRAAKERASGVVARRGLLVLLPEDEALIRAAWALLADFDYPKSKMTLVLVGDEVRYVPDRFAADVKTVGSAEVDWRGLPKRSVAASIWAAGAGVTINLAQPDDPRAAYLVAGSPATVRIGFYADIAPDCYDLMCKPADEHGLDYDAMRRLLGNVEPAILPIR